MRIVLPFPADELWPNKRSHWAPKARAAKKARADAHWAARGLVGLSLTDGPIPIKLIVHARPHGPLPDADNCVAAAKNLIDGVADALGINDKHFAAPSVEFAAERTAKFVIEVGS